jgi:hypothetical protein
MPEGVCKLCLKTKDLQKSHFIPKAMYRYLRDSSSRDPNPVVVGRDVTATTSKQITDYVLCAECEDLFNKHGESEVLRWVWNGKRFPLGERLAVAHQHYTFSNFLAFSGTAIGVDTEKFAYFALSVLWRASVHEWQTPFGGKTKILDLGSVGEPVRQYLHRQTTFPTDVVVIATACTDPASSRAFYVPSTVPRAPSTAIGMLTLGIDFMVLIGHEFPAIVREMCCARSAPRLIFQRDCGERTIEAFAQIMETTRRARAMK